MWWLRKKSFPTTKNPQVHFLSFWQSFKDNQNRQLANQYHLAAPKKVICGPRNGPVLPKGYWLPFLGLQEGMFLSLTLQFSLPGLGLTVAVAVTAAILLIIAVAGSYFSICFTDRDFHFVLPGLAGARGCQNYHCLDPAENVQCPNKLC